jgi:hypothetical protein
MSRTDKDRPYDVIARDKTAYPENPRYALHWHFMFGRARHRTRMMKDERGNPLFTIEEVDRAVLDTSGQWPVYRYEKRLVKRYRFESVVVGHFADYCTADIHPRDLPAGILPPCRPAFGRMRQGNSQAEERDWYAGDRRHVRDTLRRHVAEYRANGDIEDSFDVLETRHRRGASWWY